jgi:hypothetical protein
MLEKEVKSSGFCDLMPAQCHMFFNSSSALIEKSNKEQFTICSLSRGMTENSCIFCRFICFLSFSLARRFPDTKIPYTAGQWFQIRVTSGGTWVSLLAHLWRQRNVNERISNCWSRRFYRERVVLSDDNFTHFVNSRTQASEKMFQYVCSSRNFALV